MWMYGLFPAQALLERPWWKGTAERANIVFLHLVFTVAIRADIMNAVCIQLFFWRICTYPVIESTLTAIILAYLTAGCLE
jgi:hypothetical protein